jgi:membrane protein implicated in regulation of membrane protease activity
MAENEVHPEGEPAGERGEAIHLPGPTYIPVVVAFGLTLLVCGVVISLVMSAIGAVITIIALVRWIRDTRRDISELPLEH